MRCELAPHSALMAATLVLASFLSGCHHRPGGSAISQNPLEVIPAKWVDVPESPFVAAIRSGKAVLVNRTDRSWDSVSTGCIVRQEGAVRVAGQLFSQSIDDNIFRPGGLVEGLLPMINNIDYYVANEERIIGRTGVIRRCSDDARIGVTAAALRDEYRWSADGTAWAK